MKKILFGIALVLIVSMFGACESDDRVRLTLWTIWSSETESNRAPFLKTLEQFREAHPGIRVDLEMADVEAFRTRIRTAAAANNLPDVFYFNAGGALRTLVDAGRVLPLNDYIEQEVWDRLIDGTLINMTFNGNIYGLPYSLATSVLFCNVDLFEAHNVKIPETWDELMTAVRTFRAAGITPMAVGGRDRWPACMYTDIILMRAAGFEASYATFNRREDGDFLSDGMRLGAQKIKELIDAGAFPPDAAALTRDESEVFFFMGQIPMYVNGNWTAGNIQAEGSAIRNRVVAVPFPAIEGGAGSINDFMGGAAEQFSVSAGTRNRGAAVMLAQFLAENHSRNAYIAGAGIPTWHFDDIDTSGMDPLFTSIAALTRNAENFLLWGDTTLEGQDSELYLDTVQELLMGEMTAIQFLERLQTGIINR